MKTHEEVKTDNINSNRISLSKLLGINVVDIEGHISPDEGGELGFRATKIVLSNGIRLEIESEWASYEVDVWEDDSNSHFADHENHHSHTVLGLFDNHQAELNHILETHPLRDPNAS